MAKEKKEKRYHNGLEVDSDEEVLCLLWLEELMIAGYVLKIERAQTFELFDGLTNVYEEQKQLKTKVNTIEKRQVLLAAHEYTPEFKVTWAEDKFQGIVNMSRGWRRITETLQGQLDGDITDSIVTYLEVKPEWDQNNMERLFKINQKWMYEKYGIFVNLIKPHKLCEATFTPRLWLLTPTGKKRVIHWPIKTLEEYLETLNSK